MADELASASENEDTTGEILDRMQRQIDELKRKQDDPPNPFDDHEVPEHTTATRVPMQPQAIIPQGSIPPPPPGGDDPPKNYFLYAQDGVLFWMEAGEC